MAGSRCGVLGPQQLIHVVEVFPRLADRARAVVIEDLILVAGDDPAGAQGFNGVDRFAPCLAATIAGFAQILVDAVVIASPATTRFRSGTCRTLLCLVT